MGVFAVGGGRGELRRIEWRERLRTYGSERAGLETQSEAVARRRTGVLAAGIVCAAEEAEGTTGRVEAAVSAALKENTLFSVLLSTGPADSGGVAVMELGKRTSCKFAIAGESGCAVRGVSGNVETNGAGAP